MALCTRAKVLQRLGLTDDATSEAALVIYSSRLAAKATVASNTLTLAYSGGTDLTADLTAAANDTFSELVTVIDALSNWGAELVAGVSGSTASTTLDDLAETLLTSTNSTSTLAMTLEYTNAASGTVSALIDQLITEVDLAIGRYCGRTDEELDAQTFESATYTENYSGDGGRTLQLRQYPVTSITSIKYRDSNGDLTTLDSTGYRVNERSGVVSKISDDIGWELGLPDSANWVCGHNNYQVVYVAGFSTVPADLEGAAIDMVCEMFLNRRANARAASEGQGGRSISYLSPDDLARKHAHRLAPYRNLGVVV